MEKVIFDVEYLDLRIGIAQIMEIKDMTELTEFFKENKNHVIVTNIKPR